MSKEWFDNQAGLVDYVKTDRNLSYQDMDYKELIEQLKIQEVALEQHRKHYINTWDIESSKAMKRCGNRIRVIKRYLSKINDFDIDEQAAKIFKEKEWKLKNQLKNRDDRINKLLRDVDRYKSLHKSNNRELQVMRVFKKLCNEKIGRKEMLELISIAESEVDSKS